MKYSRGEKARIYPWKEMRVGDSFVLDKVQRFSAQSNARIYGIKLLTRSISKDNVRCWRVE